MQKMNPQDIKYGYIIVPKTLLTEQFTNCDTHEGEVEAFLKIIMKTNYSETQHTDYWNNVIVCQRGESLHSYRNLERHLALVGEQNLPFHTTSAN